MMIEPLDHEPVLPSYSMAISEQQSKGIHRSDNQITSCWQRDQHNARAQI